MIKNITHRLSCIVLAVTFQCLILTPHPPGQHLLCLISQYWIISFDHDGEGWCDSGLQQPFHSLFNKILLVLKNRSSIHKMLNNSCSREVLWSQSIRRPLFCVSLFYLWVLLRHVLLWELGELNQLRHNVLLIVTVGAVYQGASYCIQDRLVLGLKIQRKPWSRYVYLTRFMVCSSLCVFFLTLARSNMAFNASSSSTKSSFTSASLVK